MTPDGAEETEPSEQKARLTSPVGLVAIQHIGHGDCANNVEE